MQSVKRNKLRISTVIRAVTFLFFVVAAYGPWVLAFVLDKSFDAIDWKTWTLLAVIAGAANAVSALWRRDDDSPRTMALWGLILKLCLLPLLFSLQSSPWLSQHRATLSCSLPMWASQ